jgi:hypothetical protein
LAGPGEFTDGVLPTRHRHQECFSAAADLEAIAVLPSDVRCPESQSTYATSRAQTRVSRHQRQNPFQAINGHGARMPECPTDVLVVDGSIDERNHAAETGGQPTRLKVTAKEVNQLLR